MDYLKFETDIKDYFTNNLPSVLTAGGLDNFDSYIDDVVDLDQYKKSKQLFYSWDSFQYSDSTNQSNSEEFTFSVFIVFMNGKRTALQNEMMKYSAAIYKMFADSGNNFDGVADYGIIESVSFYPMAEGNPSIKVAELTFRLITER